MFGNPNQFNGNYKDLFNSFYRRNKVVTWLIVVSLAALIFSRAKFFDVFWYVYLIYFAGVFLKYYFTDIKILNTFIGGAVAGLLVYGLVFSSKINIYEMIIVTISSGALAMLTKLITYTPNVQMQMLFFGKVKLIYIGLIIIGLDILTINFTHPNYRIAHLGGIAFGFLSIYLMKSKSFNFAFNIKSLFKKKGPYYNKKKQTTSRPISDEEYNTRRKENQEEIDKILEKIKHRGYESLSAEEKRKLFEQSKK